MLTFGQTLQEHGFVRQRLQLGGAGALIVEDNTQEGTVNLQATVIVNEAQLPKLIHKQTHS